MPLPLLLVSLVSTTALAQLQPKRFVNIDESIIPQVANGGTLAGGYFTVFQFVNVSPGLATVRVEFFDSTGEPMSLPLSSGPTDLTGTARTGFGMVFETGGSSYQATVPNGSPTAVGYAKVTMDPRRSVGVNATFAQIVPGRPLFMTGVPPSNDSNTTSFMPYVSQRGFTPSLALVAGRDLSVTLIARTGSNGNEICKTTFTLDEDHHRAFLLRDVLACVPGTSGAIEIRSSEAYGYLAGIGFQAHDSGAFVTQPIWTNLERWGEDRP